VPLTKALIQWMVRNQQLESKTLDDFAQWYATPDAELQNHILGYFKWFADFTDYVKHNQYFSGLNHARSIQYNTVAILVMSYHCDEQDVGMVHCAGSTWCRNHNQHRSDRVLHSMEMSPDSHFQSTAGCIPARWLCHVVVWVAEFSVPGLLAFVKTIVTGLINKKACTVIVERRYNICYNPSTMHCIIVSLYLVLKQLILSL